MGSGSCLGAGDAFCFFSSLFFSVEVNYMTCTDVLVPAPNWSAQSRKEWRWVTDPTQTQEQKRGRQVRERTRSADTKRTNWKGEKMSDNSFYPDVPGLAIFPVGLPKSISALPVRLS